MERTKQTATSLSIEDRDPIHWALNELIVRVVEVMLREIGVSETLSIVKPRSKYSGRAMARNFSARFLSNPTDMEAIAIAPFCGRCIGWGGKGRLTFYEKGAVLEYSACPWTHGPPEICIIVSHYVAEGACEEVNPDYEFVYTHHMTQGDPSCIGILRRRGDVTFNAAHPGNISRSIENLEMDDSERDALSFNLEGHMLAILLDSLTGATSPEMSRELLGQTFKEWGQRAGEKLKNLGNAEGRTYDPLSLLLTLRDGLGHGNQVNTTEQGGIKLISEGCIYSHSLSVVCELMESFWANMVKTIDPKATIKYRKFKDGEDEACQLILLTPEPSKDISGDPLAILKMRFVKGEITEEEFLRKRDLLLER